MAKTDSLTPQRLRELLHYDPITGLFTWRLNRGGGARAGSVAGSPNSDGYIHIGMDGVLHKAHRLAWLYMKGEWPTHQVDHENTIRGDNWWKNLRPATNAQNAQNKRSAQSNNKSGLLGVSPHKTQWKATIVKDGKKKHIGLFGTPELAHAAYLEAKAARHPFQTLVQI